MKKGSIIFKQCIKKISFVLVLILTMGIIVQSLKQPPKHQVQNYQIQIQKYIIIMNPVQNTQIVIICIMMKVIQYLHIKIMFGERI